MDASFSPSPSPYFALMCKGPSLPFACLCETEANRMLDVYEDNSRLERRMGGKTLPGVRMMEVGEWGVDVVVAAAAFYRRRWFISVVEL